MDDISNPWYCLIVTRVENKEVILSGFGETKRNIIEKTRSHSLPISYTMKAFSLQGDQESVREWLIRKGFSEEDANQVLRKIAKIASTALEVPSPQT